MYQYSYTAPLPIVQSMFCPHSYSSVPFEMVQILPQIPGNEFYYSNTACGSKCKRINYRWSYEEDREI